MSENQTEEHKQKKEVVENKEENQQERIVDELEIGTDIETEVEAEEISNSTTPDSTKVVKKNTFLTVLAFLLSLLALAASAFLYLFNDEDVVPTNDMWKKPLASLETQITNKTLLLEKSLKSKTKEHQQFTRNFDTTQKEIAQLKQGIDNFKKTNSSGTSVKNDYDDSAIQTLVSTLGKKIDQQSKHVDLLKKELSDMKTAYERKITQLESKIVQQSQIQSLVSVQKPTLDNAEDEIFHADLLAAYRYSLLENKPLTLKHLKKVEEKINDANQEKYNKLALSVSLTIDKLNHYEPVDTLNYIKQINGISREVNDFEFPKLDNSKKEPEKDAWYNKLITVRKVSDDSQQAKITVSEQYAIKNRLKSQFEILKLSLTNQDRAKWKQTIKTIIELIDKHFPNQSTESVNQLNKLKDLNIGLMMPDLSPLLEEFKSLQAQTGE